MMRGFLFAPDGQSRVVSRKDWNAMIALNSVLHCLHPRRVMLPAQAGMELALFVDGDSTLIELEVNTAVSALLAEHTGGEQFRGNALFVGYSRKSERVISMGLAQMFQLGRKVLEARQLT